MPVMEIDDKLYGLPLAEFTQARDKAARELRKAGRREEADRVKALRKPTVAAGAVNRLVREHRDDVEGFLRAAAALRDAQFSGKAELAAARKKEREALAGLTRTGGEAVRQSLLAAAVDDDAARQLLEARLDRELEPRGFGTLLAYAPPGAPKLRDAPAGKRPDAAGAATPSGRSAPRDRPAPRDAPAPRADSSPPGKEQAPAKAPDDTAARARRDDAKAALAAAEAEERRARRHWDRARRDLEKALAAADKAERDLTARTR
jgi:hypothetical protein